MFATLRQKVRPAEPQQTIAAGEQLRAAGAEVRLLRSLLRRCEGVLQDVAMEARSTGERDSLVEDLLRDILVATE